MRLSPPPIPTSPPVSTARSLLHSSSTSFPCRGLPFAASRTCTAMSWLGGMQDWRGRAAPGMGGHRAERILAALCRLPSRGCAMFCHWRAHPWPRVLAVSPSLSLSVRVSFPQFVCLSLSLSVRESLLESFPLSPFVSPLASNTLSTLCSLVRALAVFLSPIAFSFSCLCARTAVCAWGWLPARSVHA